MNVLSLFDGISCGRVALDRCGIAVKTYYASEVDGNAIAVSQKNWPDIVQLGDVREVKGKDLPAIDLLIGGSPCQDLSIAKKERKGLDGDRSGLFWEYVRIWKECKPRWFILENVASMSAKDRDTISEALGCEPVMVNAGLVSAQNRKRLFWTNIAFEMPADRGIVLKDILQDDADVEESMTMKGKAFCLTSTYHKTGETQSEYDHNKERRQRTMVRVGHIGSSNGQANRVYDVAGKSCTLSANGGGLGAKTGLYQTEGRIRKLTCVECERLQGLPDGYTEGIAKTNRYKALGNAFNVEVVVAILRGVGARELP